MKQKEIEIFASVYATSDESDEVYAKMNDCPIQRQEGKMNSIAMNGEDTHEMCVCYQALSGRGVKRNICPHFQGCKQVQRKKRKKIKIFCSALENK
ncbi:hypothetical protein AT268_33170 [Bacillus cereus]|uniref:Uncharacterized protein n=1 Tax=Bacillus cereus TaxID=1396 RepID=A0A9X0SQL4_BACCE|nr:MULTISPECIES: hypothetical protein [Bacillus cereus group]KXY51333.1 hypothetical protein AT268_33170 [Bacillus cereus]PEZ74887.1 hypothetical protein CN410_12175 [Bacillus anthracis]PFA29671.1 hypothetical protein CN384_08290 [Bacillus thuringiensis]PGW11046.1 hypothetical protein COD97_15745 [Bacillus cereus]